MEASFQAWASTQEPQNIYPNLKFHSGHSYLYDILLRKRSKHQGGNRSIQHTAVATGGPSQLGAEVTFEYRC